MQGQNFHAIETVKQFYYTYFRVWLWIKVCVIQLYDFEQSWGTKSTEKNDMKIKN